MSSVSKTILIGNLGADPETKYLPSGDAVVNFSIATSEKWKDRQTGQPQEVTDWHKCVAFGKAAEVIAQYAKKGSKLYVEGQNKTRKWQGQDGQDRYMTEVKVREFQFLDSRGSDSVQGGYQQPPAQSQAPQSQGQPQGGFNDFDDDTVPF